ncbi:penicillin acylase family protein [Zeaxanthinibacter enoshimensis]|uniref:Penicillin amidase n=1 Tax=Zeaxanthinibacter enoshimensis TaxID=392009 RepID=A0A4R6TPI7_9FLAO|nr:penicillin acylase family protein [Zeaxanthinibacter enoshimensis]TDQ31281.1 penicillin amidase [Zeaxanthinibacter enoshimensis]
MRIIVCLCISLLLFSCKTENKNSINLAGLHSTVEIKRDQWGLNHIYAENEHDLFFAQGYAAARDRLFQFEIWRRQATGTVAEILGEREFKRDLGTRLFKFRGDMTEEMNHYHPRGAEIITAYTDGVNAYIDEVLRNPGKLPIEFKLLGIKPGKWTPEVVISRHQGLLGNIEEELEIGRAVAVLGPEKVSELYWFHPQEPEISLDTSLTADLLSGDILELYKAYRQKVVFRPEDIVPEYREPKVALALNQLVEGKSDHHSIGSNNWVIDDTRTVDGHTYMANDPHRTIAVPSLRYMAHLVAPGWNVIGGGEPEIPGISIGHNEYGSWGLTVFETDGEDLYVYDLNPENLEQYRYGDGWEEMRREKENIEIKGKEAKKVTLRYTRHGPVTMIDSVNHKAYAVRCAWLEPGGSPYLASLRMDQAKTWEEFREACSYSHIPGENMIWADKEGNIGWQAVGIAPVRPNFSGLVPVPGNGKYEWDGYLPIKEKPHSVNPEKGYIATANQNVIPADYQRWDAVGYTWADPYRGERIEEVLSGKNKLSMEEMKALQVDYVSIPARQLTPLLLQLELSGKAADALELLRDWDHSLDPGSVPAAIYVAFENTLGDKADERFIPEAAKGIIKYLQMKRVVDWVTDPGDEFGAQPLKARDEFLQEVFTESVAQLEKDLGPDMDKWQYGQEKFKHTVMEHALGKLVNDSLAARMNLGPLPRGGNSYTPGSTGGNKRQSSGASFRMIVNSGDWDAAEATNAPGQSGDPSSEFYGNLFETWARDEYFPVYFSEEKIDSVTVERLLLVPAE